MIEAPHYSAAGTKKKSVRLPAALFDGTVNEPVLHRAVITFLANQRQGTADTKTRSEVSGGNQKPWRQKGTGRARQGSTRAPHWRHGGIVFGPHPRSYRLGIPKKMRQLARKSALNARAGEQALFVVDALEYEKPKTKTLAELLTKLGVADKKVLVLTAGAANAHNVYLSGRNIPDVRVMRFADATAYEILWSSAVVVELPALGEASAKAEGEADGEREGDDA
jgi:large subunit ribosomal protein L4